MRVFEMLIAQSATSHNGGPFITDERLTYAIPDEAFELLKPILEQYGQDPLWYFDKLNFGRPPAPWAIACLDQEYRIASHVVEARQGDRGLSFAPYTQVPNPIPPDFIPAVGALVILERSVLVACASRSPLLQTLWSALSLCDPSKRWLAMLDPLDDAWVASVTAGDDHLWCDQRRQ